MIADYMIVCSPHPVTDKLGSIPISSLNASTSILRTTIGLLGRLNVPTRSSHSASVEHLSGQILSNDKAMSKRGKLALLLEVKAGRESIWVILCPEQYFDYVPELLAS